MTVVENNISLIRMDIKNYQEFLVREATDSIIVYVEPAIARRFFTEINQQVMQEKIGESLSIERFLITACLLLEFPCLLGGMIVSIFALKWYSIIAILIMVGAFFILGATSSMGKQRIRGAILLLIVCALLAYYLRDKGIFMTLWLILLPLPYFFTRLKYKLATMFLYSLVIHNEKAFNLLNGKGILLKER